MLVSLPAQFMGGQMVSFAMGDGCGGVGMSGEVVQFYDPRVGAGGH